MALLHLCNVTFLLAKRALLITASHTSNVCSMKCSYEGLNESLDEKKNELDV